MILIICRLDFSIKLYINEGYYSSISYNFKFSFLRFILYIEITFFLSDFCCSVFVHIFLNLKIHLHKTHTKHIFFHLIVMFVDVVVVLSIFCI